MKTVKKTISKLGAEFFHRAARVAAKAPCWGALYQPKTPKQLQNPQEK